MSLVIGLIAFQQVQFRWWSAVLFYERKRDMGIYYIVSFIFPSSIWLDRPLCQAIGGWIQDGMMLISHGGFTFQYNCGLNSLLAQLKLRYYSFTFMHLKLSRIIIYIINFLYVVFSHRIFTQYGLPLALSIACSIGAYTQYTTVQRVIVARSKILRSEQI